MFELHLPKRVVFEQGKKATEGQLVVEPCEAGFGTTLGNALRRVLLSSLPGAAVTDVKIGGAQHEFSTIPGVKEDVVEILLQVKQLRLKIFSDEPVRFSLRVKKEGKVTAGDIEKNASIEIANPGLHLATVTDVATEFTMEFIAQRGRGYDPVESRERPTPEIGLLAVDALYTPMRNVGFRVDNVRVGQMTNYDRLTMTIETDGTITGEDAVKQSAKILIDHFALLASLGVPVVEVSSEVIAVPEKQEVAAAPEETAVEDASTEAVKEKKTKKKKNEE